MFVVLGIGGTGSNPADLYISQLKEVSGPLFSRGQLARYYGNRAGRFFLAIPALRLQ